MSFSSMTFPSKLAVTLICLGRTTANSCLKLLPLSPACAPGNPIFLNSPAIKSAALSISGVNARRPRISSDDKTFSIRSTSFALMILSILDCANKKEVVMSNNPIAPSFFIFKFQFISQGILSFRADKIFEFKDRIR